MLLSASAQSAEVVVATTWIGTEPPAAIEANVQARVRLSVPDRAQPSTAGSSDQSAPDGRAGRVSLTTTLVAGAVPALDTLIRKPMTSPPLTVSRSLRVLLASMPSSASFSISMSAQLTTIVALSLSEPLLPAVTDAVLG